jgi:hypothetical protein
VAEGRLVEPEPADGGRRVATAHHGEPVDPGQRRRHRAGALGEGVELEDAHRTVPEDRPGIGQGRREGLAGLRADVEADLVRGDPVDGYDGRLGVRRELRCDHDVGRQQDLHAGLLGPSQVAAAGVELVLLEEAPADLEALGREEGEHHPTADQQPVGLAEQVVDDPQLVGDLRAAQDDGVGPFRVLGEPAQHGDLGGDQAAHGVREPLRDVVHRRLLAVHHTEAVADEGVGQLRELVGERAADGVVLAGLALVEADVLQHRDLAVGQAGHHGVRRVPDGVLGEPHLGAEQLGEPGRHRAQGVPRVRGALGTAEMRDDQHPGAGRGELGDGRHAGPDPAVVGDPVTVQRDVQVGAHQHALAVQVTESGELAHPAFRGSRRRR